MPCDENNYEQQIDKTVEFGEEILDYEEDKCDVDQNEDKFNADEDEE